MSSPAIVESISTTTVTMSKNKKKTKSRKRKSSIRRNVNQGEEIPALVEGHVVKSTNNNKKKRSNRKGSAAPFMSPLTASTISQEKTDKHENQGRAQKLKKRADTEFFRSHDNEEMNKKKKKRAEDDKWKAKREKERAEEEKLTALLFGGGTGVMGSGSMGVDNHESHYDGDTGGGTQHDDDYRNINSDDFGKDSGVLALLSKKKINKTNNSKKQKSDAENTFEGLFMIDRSPIVPDKDDDDDDEADKTETHEDKNKHSVSAAAWQDDDDDDDEDGAGEEDDGDESYQNHEQDETSTAKKTSAAWVDEDDQNITVNVLSTNRLRKLRTSRNEGNAHALPGDEFQNRLRQRFEATQGGLARTDWADLNKVLPSTKRADGSDEGSNTDEDDGEDEDDGIIKAEALLSSTAPLLSSTTSTLPPNIIQLVRCPDANITEPNKASVQAVHFHRGSDNEDKPLMLTAGLDKTLRFFKVDGEKNEKVHGIHFQKLPIHSASFLGNTGNVVVSGRRKFFYIYDSVAGKLDMVPRIMGREERSLETFTTSPDGRTIAFIGNDGYIILVDAKTKRWIDDLKMNGSARAVTFTPDGEHVIASGSDGDVYRWDLQSRRCIDRFRNEDGTITSALSASSRFLAVGAESGVVNLYNDRVADRAGIGSTRKPIKSIMNLHTSADVVKFNHDGQVLAMSTRREKNSMKLLHVPTATVFSNWPTSKTPLNYAWSLDFSPGSKFLAVGNDKGKCLLYRLKHYDV